MINKLTLCNYIASCRFVQAWSVFMTLAGDFSELLTLSNSVNYIFTKVIKIYKFTFDTLTQILLWSSAATSNVIVILFIILCYMGLNYRHVCKQSGILCLTSQTVTKSCICL